MKLLDILLFPKSLYRRITNKKLTLFLGIILIGAVDLGFPLSETFSKNFIGKTHNDLVFNIVFVSIVAIILGVMDSLFFAKPLFDLFKVFKKKAIDIDKRGNLVKVMKVYMVSHLLIIPLNILAYAVMYNVNLNNHVILALLIFTYSAVMPVWFAGAITRGVNAIYNFELLFIRLAFVAIFIWNMLISFAFDFMYSHWIIGLLK